jgi:hypothetical protein
MKRTWALIGILLIFGAGVWNFFVKHRWTDRIPRGWEWRNNFVGFSAFADPQTKKTRRQSMIAA